MSAHMKGHHTDAKNYIDVRVGLPSGKKMSYHLPNTKSALKELDSFLKDRDVEKNEITDWEKATPWDALAKSRIEKYKRAGIVLRGARYRENMSQNELAKKTGQTQDNISKIENGKRTVGEKLAKKFAKVLNIDYRLLLE